MENAIVQEFQVKEVKDNGEVVLEQVSVDARARAVKFSISGTLGNRYATYRVEVTGGATTNVYRTNVSGALGVGGYATYNHKGNGAGGGSISIDKPLAIGDKFTFVCSEQILSALWQEIKIGTVAR